MTSLKHRIQSECFPTWRVTKARPYLFNPEHEIEVKVQKPLGENSRIKIKGNAIGSPWVKMEMPFYYVGKARKKFRIPRVTEGVCELLVHIKASVRVPSLEEQHREELRIMRKKEYRKAKKT